MHPIDIGGADAIAKSINSANARTASRAERIAATILAVVLGCIGAAAALHFGLPCEAGSLCMAPAVVTRTRTTLWDRLRWRLQAGWIRYRIGTTLADLRAMDEMEQTALQELQAIPLAREAYNRYVSEQQAALDRITPAAKG